MPLVYIGLIGLCTAGCFRTEYRNFYAPDHEAMGDATGRRSSETWRNFFVFGWVPGEMEIDAAAVCGEGNVRKIETQLSFLQGFVTALTSFFYINIYSPWTGEVHCSG